MPRATFRFHGDLNDFLPAHRRGTAIEYAFEGIPGVKDAIEAIGVPHPEVDLVVLNGRPVRFATRIADGDEIDVFPVRGAADRPPELAATRGLVPAAPVPPRFILDGHLGRLARHLRMLGFDAEYDRAADDETLARRSADEGRILLTRDRGLLKRGIVTLGYLVRPDDPRRQLSEVADRYGLCGLVAPFSRCIRCNGRIAPVDREAVAAELAGEPRTLAAFTEYGRCEGCGAIYWPGSHFGRMSDVVRDLLAEAG